MATSTLLAALPTSNWSSISCSSDHNTAPFTPHSLSQLKMTERRTSRHPTSTTARPRQTTTRSERLGLSEAPQTSALQEGPLSVQAPKQGINVSPLASSGRQAGSLVSREFHIRSSRKQRNVEGKPGLERSSGFH